VSLGTTLTRDRELAFSLYPSDGGSSLARDTAGVEAQFRVYEGVGHTPRPAKEDIVEFHRRSIEGDDVSEFGQRLGIHAFFERTPIRPAASEPVEFDEPGEYTVELTIVDSSGQSDDAWLEVVVGESTTDDSSTTDPEDDSGGDEADFGDDEADSGDDSTAEGEADVGDDTEGDETDSGDGATSESDPDDSDGSTSGDDGDEIAAENDSDETTESETDG
jgi:hypothetical protein